MVPLVLVVPLTLDHVATLSGGHRYMARIYPAAAGKIRVVTLSGANRLFRRPCILGNGLIRKANRLRNSCGSALPASPGPILGPRAPPKQ